MDEIKLMEGWFDRGGERCIVALAGGRNVCKMRCACAGELNKKNFAIFVA